MFLDYWSNVVDVKVIIFLTIFLVVTSECKVIFVESILLLIWHSFIDSNVFRDFSKLLEFKGFLGVVLVYHVTFIITELSYRNHDNVSGLHPHSVSQFPTYSSNSLGSIFKTVGFDTALSQEPENLCVVSSLLLYEQLSLLTGTPVLSSLSGFTSLSSSSRHFFN